MDKYEWFLLGLCIGFSFGVAIMSILIAARRADDISGCQYLDEMERLQAKKDASQGLKAER